MNVATRSFTSASSLNGASNATPMTEKMMICTIYKDQRIHIQFYQENECRCLAERIMSAADGQPAADYRKGDKDGEDQP